MKKKRILLHAFILLLAAICIGCTGYVLYWEDQNLWKYKSENYTDLYQDMVSDLMVFGNAQAEYREKYSDINKVLIENEQFGNVTVRDMAELYNKDVEYSEAEDEDNVYGKTIYGLQESAEEAFQENPTEENKRKCDYYTDIYYAFEDYRECVEHLVGSGTVVEDKPLDLEKIQYSYADNIHAPEFCYSIVYKIGEETYTIANFDADAISDTEQYKDINIFENGKLVIEDNPYGIKNLKDCLYRRGDGFGQKTTKMVFAINTSYNSETSMYDSSNYPFLNYINEMKNAPSKQQIKRIQENEIICGCIAIGTVLIAVIPFIMLMMMAGHRRKEDEPELVAVDKIWLDVGLAAVVTVYVVLAYLVDMLYDEGFYDMFAVCASVLGLTAVELVLLFSESFARRIKTKSFLDTIFIGKVWILIKKPFGKLRRGMSKLLDNVNLTIKIVIFGIVLFIGIVICGRLPYTLDGELYLLMAILVVVCICYLLWRYFSEYEMLENGAKKIAGGEIDYKIQDEMKFRANKTLKDSINHIGEGLNTAVEESIKNERMKTELITNVSHDLKTPLTSIINYVDLLKTEGIDSEQANKYLDVLDQKSQRLKNLTEDLVEASKLNSGVAKLERQKLDIVQLVNQSIAEYDEKFGQKNLQIVKTIQEEPLYVMADGRKTWRLFDNLYNNIFKYAMAGTRVYIDIRVENRKAVISLKNISESPLNFSADELMERFVRGDVARTTEGSGLGLSIARSIVERQDGEMNITLDGDLFKVEVMMNLV